MKNNLYILSLLMLLASCGEQDPQTRLEALKKQQREIKEEIAALETELAKSGNKKVDNAKMVGLTTLEKETFNHIIEVQARVEGEENVMVSPEMMGTVNKVMVKVGDKVSAGSVLAELENSVYRKSLDELLSAREFANTLYLKQKSLWDQKIGTEVQFLQAKNSLESIDKKILTVKQQLEMARIKSPIAGTVDAVDIKIGQAFAPGMPGIRVVNFAKLKVQAEVAEAYISKIKKGDPVEIFIPDNAKTVKASIDYSGKVIDPLNRTFRVEVSMKGQSADLHPNQVAVLKITDYRSADAITLPISVVQTTPEGSYVFVVNGNKAEKRMVTTGQQYQSRMEILSGLQSGERVVTTGYQDLTDGQSIQF